MSRKIYIRWKAGFWHAVEHRFDGERYREKWHSLGVKDPKKTKRRQAERALHEWELSEVKDAANAARGGTKSDLSIADAATRFLASHGPTVRGSSLRLYRYWYARFVAEYGAMKLSELRAEHVDRWKASLLAIMKPGSVNSGLEAVKMMLNHYGRDEVARRVRAARVDRVTFPQFITHVEFREKLLPCIRSPKMRVVCCLAMYAGLRVAEIRHLRWAQIDFNDGVIRLESDEGFQTKSGRGRIVPLYSSLHAELIKCARGHQEYVTGGPHGMVATSKWSTIVRMACRESGLPELTMHGLRHSFATWAAGRMPLPVLQKLLGHSNITTTMMYVHVSEDSAITTAKQHDL